MRSTVDRSSWIRRFQPVREASHTLVFLPHAGGTATYYYPLASRLSDTAEVLAVQYPGRQDRLGEAPLESIEDIADHTAEALLPWAGRRLALFGHSMGAAVAFEVTRRLEAHHRLFPSVVFVSGGRAPSLSRDERVHLLNDDGLVAELREQGGTDSQILDNAELLEMLLPAVRGDYKAIERYRCSPGAHVASPIVALTGSDDAEATVEEVEPWRGHTSSDFELRVFPGGHFYLHDDQDNVADLIKAKLAAFTT